MVQMCSFNFCEISKFYTKDLRTTAFAPCFFGIETANRGAKKIFGNKKAAL